MKQNNMTSNRLNRPADRKATLEVVTSFELWDYLLDGRTIANQAKGGRHRYSKAEAFFDLLDRQRISNSTFDDGYMNSSVMLLASAWGWMRPTAKKFLDRLADMGVVTLTHRGNSTVVRINNIVGEDTTTVSSPDRLDGSNESETPEPSSGTVARPLAGEGPAATP
jgi:hypothetical protein